MVSGSISGPLVSLHSQVSETSGASVSTNSNGNHDVRDVFKIGKLMNEEIFINCRLWIGQRFLSFQSLMCLYICKATPREELLPQKGVAKRVMVALVLPVLCTQLGFSALR